MELFTKYKLASFILDLTLFVCFQISYILLPITKNLVKAFLNECDIHVNGCNASDPKVNDNRFYCELLVKGSSGIGYAYVEKYFDCDDLVTLCEKIHTDKNYRNFHYHPATYFRSLIAKYLFVQTERTAYENVGKGYDKYIVNMKEFNIQRPNQTWSAGYWKNADSLGSAIKNKCDLVARKLKLSPKMWILDAGCGEGVLCKYLAENYDVSVVGIDVSKECILKARQNCDGLSVSIKEMSCMRITGLYDRIACIQTLSHLGYWNIRPFFQRMHRHLAEDGLLLMECVVRFNSSVPPNEDFIEHQMETKYYIPTMKQIIKCIDGLFVIEDVQNLTNHMVLTCFEMLKERKAIQSDIEEIHGKRYFRNRIVLKSMFAASFANYSVNVCQIVFSKNGFKNGYEAEN